MFREIEKFAIDRQTDPLSSLFSYNVIELFVVNDFLRNSLYKIIRCANVAVKITRSFILFRIECLFVREVTLFFGNKASSYNHTSYAFDNSRAMSKNNTHDETDNNNLTTCLVLINCNLNF